MCINDPLSLIQAENVSMKLPRITRWEYKGDLGSEGWGTRGGGFLQVLKQPEPRSSEAKANYASCSYLSVNLGLFVTRTPK